VYLFLGFLEYFGRGGGAPPSSQVLGRGRGEEGEFATGFGLIERRRAHFGGRLKISGSLLLCDLERRFGVFQIDVTDGFVIVIQIVHVQTFGFFNLKVLFQQDGVRSFFSNLLDTKFEAALCVEVFEASRGGYVVSELFSDKVCVVLDGLCEIGGIR